MVVLVGFQCLLHGDIMSSIAFWVKIILLCAFWYFVGTYIGKNGFSSLSSGATVAKTPAAVCLSIEDFLPSQADIQRELVRRNPKAKLLVDGICGDKTRKEWNLQYNQQCALEMWPK